MVETWALPRAGKKRPSRVEERSWRATLRVEERASWAPSLVEEKHAPRALRLALLMAAEWAPPPRAAIQARMRRRC
jgi:hypothetical protein